jgi:hypothetical protein
MVVLACETTATKTSFKSWIVTCRLSLPKLLLVRLRGRADVEYNEGLNIFSLKSDVYRHSVEVHSKKCSKNVHPFPFCFDTPFRQD